ncbi:SWIB/MDM2 domain-containing protein, partial [Chytriomyces sp. MP71]
RSAKRSRGHVDDSDEDHEEHRPGKKGKSVFSKPYAPSAALAAVMGSEEPLARHAAVKGIWAYIKERGLQDPSDKRFILCDEKLQGLFEGETRVSGFGMNKYLGAHLT